ncbi:MAG: hypothetical protein ACYSYV_08595 [Planctomycetota bacterium]
MKMFIRNCSEPSRKRVDEQLRHLGRYLRAFEFYQVPVDAIRGRRADFDMQVRNPHRAVLLKVIQHIENTELIVLCGRVNLCRSRIFFRHICLHCN